MWVLLRGVLGRSFGHMQLGLIRFGHMVEGVKTTHEIPSVIIRWVRDRWGLFHSRLCYQTYHHMNLVRSSLVCPTCYLNALDLP